MASLYRPWSFDESSRDAVGILTGTHPSIWNKTCMLKMMIFTWYVFVASQQGGFPGKPSKDQPRQCPLKSFSPFYWGWVQFYPYPGAIVYIHWSRKLFLSCRTKCTTCLHHPAGHFEPLSDIIPSWWLANISHHSCFLVRYLMRIEPCWTKCPAGRTDRLRHRQ